MVDRQLVGIMLLEVRVQATNGLLAASDLVAALDQSDTDRVWYSVHGFLVAAGNLSKLMWPAKGYEERGMVLRTILQVDDASPLGPRSFRNHWEHFDERLQEWAESSKHRNIVDRMTGSLSAIQGSSDVLRHVDPEAGLITFRGDEYRISPIVGELTRLNGIALVLAGKAHMGQLDHLLSLR
jgi:hypothetical protein